MFGKWSRLMLRRPMTSAEIAQDLCWVSDSRVLAAWRLLNPSQYVPKDIARIINVLGLNTDQYVNANGFDMCRKTLWGDAGLLCGHLRYCPDCLSIGYHSMVFQHWALGSCPLHGVRLLERCPNCSEPIKITGALISRDPFACPRCGHFFLHDFSSVTKPDGTGDIRLLGMLLGDRRRDITWALRRKVASSMPPSLTFIVQRGAKATMSHIGYVQRHSIWAPLVQGRWRKFREDFVKGPRPNKPRQEPDDDEFVRAYMKEFERLRVQCHDCEDEIRRLFDRMGPAQVNVKLNDYSPLVAVAFCKTLICFGLDLGCLDRGACSKQKADEWRTSGRAGPYTMVPGGSLKLAAAEIRSLFCLILVEVATLNYLVDVNWNCWPSFARYSPGWCLESRDNALVLRIRPIARDDLPERLIKRYKGRVLCKKETVTFPRNFVCQG